MPSEEYPPSSDEEPDYRGHPNAGHVHFLPPRNDDILEINVESLLGTTFELRLSSNTTIGRIKSRLQGSEGIAKQHQRLLHRGAELPDDLRLSDCGIENGATLKLVLSMRGGPINTRRVPMPTPKQQQQSHAELHNLMMRNKAQILDKIPKNGQVTVLLFREGDKVNLYHVQEKPDGSYSPLSPSGSSGGNEPNWSGRSSSLRNLLSKDPRNNPELDQRLKENAVTMTKMMELRSQLENLSMNKKKRQQRLKTTKRAESGSTSSGARPRSSRARHSMSSPMMSNRIRNSPDKTLADVSRKNTLPSRGLASSLTGSIPLPPINAGNSATDDFHHERLRDPLEDSEYYTILPLQTKTGRLSRQSSLSSTLPSLGGQELSESLINRLNKSKKSKKRSKTTQSRISEESVSSRVPQWLEKNDLHQPGAQFKPSKTTSNNNFFSEEDLDDDYYGVGDDLDDDNAECRSVATDEGANRRNIDLIDLQYRPNDEESLRIVNCRKTQKLISADIRSLVQGGNSPVRGQPKKRKPSEGSFSGLRRTVASSASESSPHLTKPSDYNGVKGSPSDKTGSGQILTLRSSSSRVSSSKQRQLPSSSHSRRTTSSRSQTSAKRPTYVANSLAPTNSGSAARRKKKSSNKPRCALPDCNKKLTLTNTFSCRCQMEFCPNHRHPEWHSCTFDYKTEGRRLLEKANPIITLPKLPKI